jgi:hypothetical protein
MPSTIVKCTPSLGNVSLFWSRMTESIIWPMGVGKSMMYLRDAVGGEIAEVRNQIVDMALEHDRTANPVPYLLWLDDDVLPMAGCLKELLALRADIASGTYFLKEPGEPQPLLWEGEFSEGPMMPFIPDKVIPIKFCGMGLTLVKIDVYKRMAKELDLGRDKYNRLRFYHTAKDAEGDMGVDATGIYSEGFTEDVWFMTQAAKVGVKAVASTGPNAFGFHTMPVFECMAEGCGFRTCERRLAYRHAGDNVTHNVSEDITGFPEKQWKQWCKGEAVRWQTPSGDVTWE